HAFKRAGGLMNSCFVARLNLDLRIAVHFARNHPAVRALLTGLQADLEGGERLGETSRPGIENDSRPAKAFIEPLVRKHQPVAINLRFYSTPAAFPFRAAQLENISKISIQLDCKRKLHGCAPVVMDSKPLLTCFLP